MSKDIVPFDFNGSDIRVVMRDGEPWFVAKDVCGVLEIGNSRQAVSYLDADEKGVISSDTLGGVQTVQIVNESGLYSLILRSRKPEAKAFKRWVTHEILPSIRKTGSYRMTRAESKEYRKLFTSTLKLAGYEQPRQYQHTTIEMKRELGFPWKPKDELSEGELRLVMAAELIATEKIHRERLNGFDTVHPACVTSSHGVRGLIDAS